MIKRIRIYKLAIKYWIRGDDWDYAVCYAERIVLGFEKSKK